MVLDVTQFGTGAGLVVLAFVVGLAVSAVIGVFRGLR